MPNNKKRKRDDRPVFDMQYMRHMIQQTGLKKLVKRTHTELQNELPFIPAMWVASEQQSKQLPALLEPLIPELQILVQEYLFRDDILCFSLDAVDFEGNMDTLLFMNCALFGLWKMAAFLARRAKRITVHWKDFRDLFDILDMARAF